MNGVNEQVTEADPAAPGRQSRRISSAFVGPLVLAGFSTYLLLGILMMEVPANPSFPGPRFFPAVLMGSGYLVSVLLALAIMRAPESSLPAEGAGDAAAARRHEASGRGAFSDWAAISWVAGGFLAFASGLPYLGWILSGALLFWCVTRAFRSPRPVFDLSIALVMSSLIYLAFGVGLGLNLPSGLLGGGF